MPVSILCPSQIRWFYIWWQKSYELVLNQLEMHLHFRCTVHSPTQHFILLEVHPVCWSILPACPPGTLDSVFLYWIFSQSTQVWLHRGPTGAPTLQARVLSFKPGASRPTDTQWHGPQQRGLEQPCCQQGVTMDSSGQRGRYYQMELWKGVACTTILL